jgi:hypothetical protein
MGSCACSIALSRTWTCRGLRTTREAGRAFREALKLPKHHGTSLRLERQARLCCAGAVRRDQPSRSHRAHREIRATRSGRGPRLADEVTARATPLVSSLDAREWGPTPQRGHAHREFRISWTHTSRQGSRAETEEWMEAARRQRRVKNGGAKAVHNRSEEYRRA